MLLVERAGIFVITVASIEISADVFLFVTSGLGFWSLAGILISLFAIHAARATMAKRPIESDVAVATPGPG
ncbi:MAG: hypothetical protein N2C12_11405 [Planctomycetales bacterium]